MNDLPPMERTITPVTGNPEITTSNNSEGMGIGKIIQWFFIIIVLAALGFNLFLYVYEGTDIISKYFKGGVGKTVEASNKTAIFGIKMLTKTLQTVSDLFLDKDTDEVLEKPKKEKKKPKGNKTNDKIQKARKKGYCYVGTYDGKRKCIEITEGDECKSKKVFDTLRECKNIN